MSTDLHKEGKRSKKRKILYLATILFIVFAVYGIMSVTDLKGDLRDQRTRTETSRNELKQKNLQLEKAKQQHKQNDTASQQQINKLEREKKDLEGKLQARLEEKSRLAKAAQDALNVITATKVATAAPLPVRSEPVAQLTAQPTGSGCEWLQSRLSALGTSASDMPAALSIATRESGCSPNARNASSGACNVFQEFPCGKWGGVANSDGHISGAMNYANARYGGWWGAYNFWQANHWW